MRASSSAAVAALAVLLIGVLLTGLSLGRLTPQIAQALDVGVDAGALVLGVEPGGPAATAGVRQGDVIVGLADRPELPVTIGAQSR